MLLGLHSRSSDIDLVVYGRDWWRARDAIADAKHSGSIQELDSATWMKIYMKRKPSIPFDEFVAHEMRKGNRGMNRRRGHRREILLRQPGDLQA